MKLKKRLLDSVSDGIVKDKKNIIVNKDDIIDIINLIKGNNEQSTSYTSCRAVSTK